MGLSALALETNPAFPSYPARMSAADVSAGLVLPDAAVALLGKGGAVATLLIVFFAVTSALSSYVALVLQLGNLANTFTQRTHCSLHHLHVCFPTHVLLIPVRQIWLTL